LAIRSESVNAVPLHCGPQLRMPDRLGDDVHFHSSKAFFEDALGATEIEEVQLPVYAGRDWSPTSEMGPSRRSTKAIMNSFNIAAASLRWIAASHRAGPDRILRSAKIDRGRGFRRPGHADQDDVGFFQARPETRKSGNAREHFRSCVLSKFQPDSAGLKLLVTGVMPSLRSRYSS
jgi:hypothetical protein